MNQIAAFLGVSPTLVQTIALALVFLACKAISRLIPDSATGWKAAVRTVAGIVSVDISSRVLPGVTIASVAAAAATTDPIPAKIEAETGAAVPIPSTQGA